MSTFQSLKIIVKNIILKAASMKWHMINHLITTALVLIFTIILYPSFSFKNIIIFGLVLFSGIFIDLDHFSLARLKKLQKQDIRPQMGWVNYCHTWQAAALILAFSVYFSIYPPLIAYAIHILIDSNTKDLLISDNSPLPKFLYHLKQRG